jgi:type IV secretion system protein VirB10
MVRGPAHEPAPPPAPAAPATPPRQVAELPKDYAAPPPADALPPGAPKLGPPLPGDLGRPFLEAQRQAGGASSAAPGPAAADPELQQALQDARQARSSRLVVQTSPRAAPPSPAVAPAEARAALPPGGAARGSALGLHPPVSPYLLQAGSTIRAALVTGVDSDLPGEVVAQVTEDVFDSVSGRWKLIPQGARLVGTYESRVGSGQSRAQLAWTRLILPDGRSVALEKEPGADAQGFAGLSDQVDRHGRTIAGAALVSTLLGVGAELGAGSGESQLLQALRTGVAGSVNQAGQQLVGKSLEVSPSLRLRPGLPVRVLVTHDHVLEPAP